MGFMPKFLIYFTFLALTIAGDDEYVMTVKDVAEALMPFGDDCDPKPEEEHVIEMVKNVEDAQYISKCFRHCIMLQFDIIKEGSLVVDKDTAVGMIGSMFDDRKNDLEEIIDDCNNKNQGITEKCENAHAHGMCIYGQMKERGFDIPEMADE